MGSFFAALAAFFSKLFGKHDSPQEAPVVTQSIQPTPAPAPNPAPVEAKVDAPQSQGPVLPQGKVQVLRSNGQPYQVEWSRLGTLLPAIQGAVARFPRVPFGVMVGMGLVESDWMHYRADGSVISRASDGFDNVPAVGAWQVKLAYHQWRVPGANGQTPEGNALLAASIIDDGMQKYGSWEQALVKLYFPGDDVNGTSQGSYVRIVREVKQIWDAAQTANPTNPTPDPAKPLVFGRVPRPPFENRIIQNSRAWDNLGPRQVKAVALHRMLGSLRGTDKYFRNEALGSALTDYGIGVEATDGAADAGVTIMWNDPLGNRAPWANGKVVSPYGDGKALVDKYDINAVNRDVYSLEISGSEDTPVDAKAFETIAAWIAYWADQAKVPYTNFPQNPHTGFSFVIWHEEFTIGTGKKCPFDAVKKITPDLIKRAQEIMKAAQTGGGTPGPTQPTTPTYAPLKPLSPAWDGTDRTSGTTTFYACKRTYRALGGGKVRQYGSEQDAEVRAPLAVNESVQGEYIVLGNDKQYWVVTKTGARIRAVDLKPQLVVKEG